MTCILQEYFAWELKHMLAAMVIVSAVAGLVALFGALALSFPAWMAFALYPVASSLTLMLLASIANSRTSNSARSSQLVRQQA